MKNTSEKRIQKRVRNARQKLLKEFAEKLIECRLDFEWNAGPLFRWLQEELER